MSFALGTATGRIEIEYDGSGVTQAQKDVDGLDKKSGSAVKGINTLGNIAGVGGLAIAGGLGVAVNAAADFEHRMSAIQAVSGATGSEFDALRNKALQLGKDTVFSAGDAGLAIEELVKAGLSVPDVLNGAADATVALAAAGEIDLPQAATIASNAMNSFNLKAEDMTGVVDNIAGAANASAIDVSDLGQSLQQVGAVANLAGLKFDDTATAIALMGNAGIRGSDAGTSLKTMFQRLQPVTDKQSNTMKDLGLLTYSLGDANKTLQAEHLGTADSMTEVNNKLSQYVASLDKGAVGTEKNAKAVDDMLMQQGGLNNAFYTAQGNTKGLAQVAGVLHKALAGMTQQQKQSTLNTLFGSDAIRGAAIMANAGAKGFNEMAASMNKTSAADVAKTRMDNFKGSMEQMKGSLETAGIAIGTVLLPFIRQLVDGVTKVLNVFLGWDKGTQQLIVGVLAAVGALLLIIAGIAKLVVFISTVQEALFLLKGTMIETWAAALGPIALVIAAIAAIVIIIIILWKHSETFRNIVLGVWNAIKTAAMAVASWFMGTLVPFFASVWNTISSTVMTVFNVIATIIRTYITIWVTIIQTVLAVIIGIWRAYWGMFGPLIKGVFGLIVAIIRLAWTIVKGIFLLTLGILKATVGAAFGAIKSAISAAMNFIKGIISAIWGYIGPYVMGVVNTMKAGISAAWNAIKAATSAIFNPIKNIISDAFDAAMTVVTGIRDRITGFFSGAADWLLDAGRDIMQGLIDGITDKIQAITDVINSVTDKVSKFLPGSPVREGPLKVLNNGYAGKQIIGMLMDGMSSQQWHLERAVGDVAGLIPAGVPAVDGRGGTITKPRRKKGAGAQRIVGTLELRNGRAYISGIAEDVDDDDDDYDDTLGRMG